MVFYTKTGKGKALFLLHSGGMSHEEWKPQLEILEKFYTVYRLDFPGHGQTPLHDSKLTIRSCGEAVIEVLHREGIDKAYFCGSSMGGATALWLALHHCEYVEKLVLYRVNYRKNEETFKQTQNMSDPQYWVNVGLDKYLAKTHEAQGGLDAWKTVIKHVSDALDPQSSDHNYSLSELESIDIPTLLICGDRDPLVPLSDLMAMHHHIKNSDLWIIPHASHVTSTNTWRADIFAQELHRFLNRKRSIVI